VLVKYQTITIADLGRVVTGKTPPTEKLHLYGEAYPFITPTDIGNLRYCEPTRYLSEQGYKSQPNHLLPEKSICVTCIASVGKICITNRPSFTNQQINSIVVDLNFHDPFFIYYLLLTQVDHLKSIASGVATPIINKTAFSEIEITVAPLPIQRRIAGILSAYDELIENSQRRIRILESMARALYREWFVHFRFPGHEEVPLVPSPLGEIPRGWEVRLVEGSFTIIGGGTPSRKISEYWEGGTIQWYSPSDLTGAGSMFMDDSKDHITDLGLKKSSARLFPAYSVMLTSRATIGAIAINTHQACTNQGFITCIPNERVPIFFLYHWLTENVLTFQRMASGATFKEISRGVFKTIQFLQPPQELVKQFESIAAPIAGQVLALQRQIQTLHRTRDLLLPRLLSGKIDVEALPNGELP